ncbi:hypothetical protein [Superficieibacter sp.]|uniref:hypothetical protein n=1 Tax=Superficieibacter sp. TaxID=2303322 RepID=UPI0028AB2510|nr:hypothetical protein [Superficieibacter sp.]
MRVKILLLSLVMAVSVTAQAKPKGVTVQDVKHLALKQCLQANYKDRTPAEGFSASSHDASFMVESYALGNAGVWEDFLKFVDKETKDFDKLTMSLHPESAKNANNVLAQCMTFYESEALDKYVQDTVMK